MRMKQRLAAGKRAGRRAESAIYRQFATEGEKG